MYDNLKDNLKHILKNGEDQNTSKLLSDQSNVSASVDSDASETEIKEHEE